MIEIKVQIEGESTTKTNKVALITGKLKINGDKDVVMDEALALITELEKNLGEKEFATVLDRWLTIEKRFK